MSQQDWQMGNGIEIRNVQIRNVKIGKCQIGNVQIWKRSDWKHQAEKCWEIGRMEWPLTTTVLYTHVLPLPIVIVVVHMHSK